MKDAYPRSRTVWEKFSSRSLNLYTLRRSRQKKNGAVDGLQITAVESYEIRLALIHAPSARRCGGKNKGMYCTVLRAER